jgi:signal transduction histidine kinase
MEEILSEWENFARSILAARDMDSSALRDEAEKILSAVAHDMESSQTEEQRSGKSRGWAGGKSGGPDESGESHGLVRLREGFNLSEMVSEYRALRASVIRLWTRKIQQAGRDELDQLTRFNEAIDQALTASIARYNAKLNQSKELLIGALGHDLRTPLGAILASSQALVRSEDLPGPAIRSAFRIVSSSERMASMINDLLDFTRTRLGASLPLDPVAVDLRSIVHQACTEIEAYHPDCALKVECSGNLHGRWDPARIGQMLSNLIRNAAKHGAKHELVTVTASGTDGEVKLGVHSRGPAIPSSDLKTIFDPLFRMQTSDDSQESRPGLGLGLHIAQQIVIAHGGEIGVTSIEGQGTTFSVRLPREFRESRRSNPAP